MMAAVIGTNWVNLRTMHSCTKHGFVTRYYMYKSEGLAQGELEDLGFRVVRLDRRRQAEAQRAQRGDPGQPTPTELARLSVLMPSQLVVVLVGQSVSKVLPTSQEHSTVRNWRWS